MSSSFQDFWNNISERNEIKENENVQQFVDRNVAQLGARAAETIVGLPGNMKKAFQESFNQANQYVKSMLPSFPDELEQPEIEKGGTREFINDLLMKAPTSEDIRKNVTPKIAEKISGKKTYLEPQSENERRAGDFTQDLVSMFAPGTGQFRMLTRLGAPIAGLMVKEGSKKLGASEETAQKLKAGAMLMTTLASESNPVQYSQNLIREGRNAVPQNSTIFVQPILNNLTRLQQRLNRGLNVPSKSRARQAINDLINQADPQGRIDFHSALDARDHINEWISEMNGWDVPAPTRDTAVRNLNEVKRSLIDTINQNYAQRFPQAGEAYRQGYEGLAVVHRSNAISNFIERNFGRQAASVGAKLLFPSALGGTALFPKAGTATLLGYPFYKTGQVLYRVAQSPSLSRYYQGVIHNATVGNVPAMVKNMNALDKALKKEEEKQFGKFKSSKQEFFDKFLIKDKS